MFGYLISFMHFAPMFIVVALFSLNLVPQIAQRAGIKFKNSSLSALIIGLCSLGIASGSLIHADHVEMFDPCVFYIVSLFVVAIQVAFQDKKSVCTSESLAS